MIKRSILASVDRTDLYGRLTIKSLTCAAYCCKSAGNKNRWGISVSDVYTGSYSYDYWFYSGTGLPGVR